MYNGAFPSMLLITISGIGPTAALPGVRPREAEAVGHLVEDVDVGVGAAKGVLAGPHGVDGDVSQRVDALGLGRGQGAVDDEAVGRLLAVGEVVGRREAGRVGRGRPRRRAQPVVLPAVRVGAEAGRDGVTGVPLRKRNC